MRMAAVLAGLVLAATLSADEAPERPAVGVALGAGLDGFAMGDVNAGRSSAITGGADLDLGVEWRALDWLSVGLESGYLMASVRQTNQHFAYPDPLVGGVLTDWNYTLSERYSALENVLQAWLLRSYGPLDLRVGGGGGLAFLAGSEVTSDAPGAQALLLYGDAPIWRLGLGADWWLDRDFSVGLEGGWRWCRIRPVTAAGAGSGTFKNADGSNFGIDFSGWTGRLSGTFWF
jgi:hypothetical protein